MHSSTFPTSPLAAIHTTLVSSVLASAVLLLARVFALIDPSRLRARLAAWDVALVTAPDGSTLVALAAVLAVLQEHGPNPGGRGPAQSLRD